MKIMYNKDEEKDVDEDIDEDKNEVISIEKEDRFVRRAL